MVGIRGRRPVRKYYEGELVEIRKPIVIHNSIALVLPKAWIYAVESKGKKLKGLALTYNTSVITVRPYYGDTGDKD